MLLLIDIGNTNITIGFWDEEIRHVLRLRTCPDKQKIINSLRDFITNHEIENPGNAILCSVVPGATPLFSSALKKGFGIQPVIVFTDMRFDLKFCVKNLRELGTDRIANAVAAHRLYKEHVIVVDFGTATTFCFISSQGVYRRGPIMPGIGISADALSERTAKLPGIELRSPEGVLGDDTSNNILSGLIFGHAGAVERIIKEIKTELSNRRVIKDKIRVSTIATGGLAHLIAPYIRGIKKTEPDLTLKGLRIIYELNV
jgi:type III pantothenate kinase